MDGSGIASAEGVGDMRGKTAAFIEEQKELQPSKKSLSAENSTKKGKHRIHPNSLANLKPYPKGVSGNPGGKPRMDVAAEIARAILENNREAAYEALGKALLKGNAYVFKELAERGYGKVSQEILVTGSLEIVERLKAARKRTSE